MPHLRLIMPRLRQYTQGKLSWTHRMGTTASPQLHMMQLHHLMGKYRNLRATRREICIDSSIRRYNYRYDAKTPMCRR